MSCLRRTVTIGRRFHALLASDGWVGLIYAQGRIDVPAAQALGVLISDGVEIAPEVVVDLSEVDGVDLDAVTAFGAVLASASGVQVRFPSAAVQDAMRGAAPSGESSWAGPFDWRGDHRAALTAGGELGIAL